ncbi:MAG: hypothetical protein R3E58_17050 [Phycisphaerae bacterium]
MFDIPAGKCGLHAGARSPTWSTCRKAKSIGRFCRSRNSGRKYVFRDGRRHVKKTARCIQPATVQRHHRDCVESVDAPIGVEMTDGDHEIVLASRDGMAVRFAGRCDGSVRRLAFAAASKDDCVVRYDCDSSGASVLTVCENGFGKRTNIDEYRLTVPRR